MKALQSVSVKALCIGVALVLMALFAFIQPARSFELQPDGSLVLQPQEKAMLQQCAARGGSGCFIVSREVVEAFAQHAVEAAVAELQAEVAARFDAAVKEQAKQVCKRTI